MRLSVQAGVCRCSPVKFEKNDDGSITVTYTDPNDKEQTKVFDTGVQGTLASRSVALKLCLPEVQPMSA